jgi:dipeptidyl aminopeptidase/acylaminoacyl peptidase
VSSLGWPEFLPDGEQFIFLADQLEDDTRVMIRSLGSDEGRVLMTSDSRVEYVEPGYLVYVLNGMLVAHPFDADAGVLTGDPLPLADSIGVSAVGLADFSASHDGTLAYRGGQTGARRLLWRDRSGRELGQVGEFAEYINSSISPDGQRVVVDVVGTDGSNMDLWIHDLERGVASRFTFDESFDGLPLWSPDASWDIWALPMDGSGEPFPVLQSEFAEVRASFSPDGRWMAFESNESGDWEVYVIQFPGPGGKWQVSTKGGSEPCWSADGREIFYLDATQNLVTVPVSTGATFKAGLPETLFEAGLFPMVTRNRFLVTDDGERFLMLSPIAGESIRPISVVLNWHAGLEP